ARKERQCVPQAYLEAPRSRHRLHHPEYLRSRVRGNGRQDRRRYGDRPAL
ncbi:MAG: hypothetical protein AVDCRST_MAG78-829, partial [uncultured Rubrobacteraceae bacterium]